MEVMTDTPPSASCRRSDLGSAMLRLTLINQVWPPAPRTLPPNLYAGRHRSALLPVPHRTGGFCAGLLRVESAASDSRTGAVAPELLLIAGTSLPAAMFREGFAM